MAKAYLSCTRLPALTQRSTSPRPHETLVSLWLYSVLPTVFQEETESYPKCKVFHISASLFGMFVETKLAAHERLSQ